MKKLKTAHEQWQEDLLVFVNDKSAHSEHVCTSLGAEGENECIYAYNKDKTCVFTKVSNKYRRYDIRNVKTPMLLFANWTKLEPQDEWYDKSDVLFFLLVYYQSKGNVTWSPINIWEMIWMDIFSEGDIPYVEYKDETTMECKSEKLSELLRDMASYIDNVEDDCERNYYFNEITQTETFHDAIGKVIERKINEVTVTTEY